MEYTGTPPRNMRYELRAKEGQVKLTVQYWNSMSIRIYANGKLVDPRPFDKKIGT